MGGARHCFVSYSHIDAEIVGRLERDLERLGWTAWCDRELSGGQRWWDGILDNIRQCDAFVFAMSESSLRSEACLRELDYASGLGKPVLPVLVGEPVPDGLLPPVLSETQRVDVRAGDAPAALALGRALMQVPDVAPLPDPLPPPPPVPITYLADLKARVEQPSLPPEEQWRLLTELEERLTRPDEEESARALLRQFADRPDLMQGVAATAARVLESGGPDAPGGPSTLADIPPPRRRRRWIVLAGAGVALAAAVTAGIIVLRGGSDEPTLATFCDRSRSADVATDRASAFLLTPGADPAEVERLFTSANSELDAVVSAAVAEIAPAARGVRTAYEEQARALAAHDWAFSGAAVEMLGILDDSELVAADQEFGTFLDEQCSINWSEVGVFTDVSTAAEGLSVAFAAFLGVSATADEAECAADVLTGEIDGDRLLSLYGQPVAATQDETELMASAIDSCIDTERLAPGFAAVNFDLPGVSPEQQTCLAEGVLDTIGLETWAATTVGTPEVIDQLTTAAESCDVDPRTVVPLIGG